MWQESRADSTWTCFLGDANRSHRISSVTRALLWTLVVTTLACASPTAPTAPLPDVAVSTGPPVVLQFRWPVPVKAVIHATSIREEATIKTRYSISVAALESSRLLVSHDDFAVTEVNGIAPADFHTVAANMDALVKVAAVKPNVLVERDGTSIGLAEPDEALAEMVVARAEDDPILAEQLLAKLAEPRAQRTVEHQYTRPWRHWVESWLGLELHPTRSGYRVVVTPEVAARHGLGTREIRVRAIGTDPSVLELEKQFRIDGEAGRRLIDAGLEPVFGLLGIPPMVEVHDLSIDASITTVMNIHTLQPSRVESRLIARAKTDHGDVEHQQVDTYELEWLAPEDPVPPMLEGLP
jgi:hypothetical protein